MTDLGTGDGGRGTSGDRKKMEAVSRMAVERLTWGVSWEHTRH